MIPTVIKSQTMAPYPVDHATIKTSFGLKDVVGNCQPDELHTLPSDIRQQIRYLTANAKTDHTNHARRRDKPPLYDPRIPTRVIHVDGFGVVKLHADKFPGQGWNVHTIEFNPGSLYNGHNGHILTEEEFLLALSILLEEVTPLLNEREDWVHIVPGLHPDSRAWWRRIEIPFHIIDGDGMILGALRLAKHKDIHLPPLYVCNEQSISFENSEGGLMIRIYRKDIEMRKKLRKKLVGNPQPVLRFEVRLEGDKLEQYLRGGSWKVIQGTSRLVSFHRADLHHPFMDVMTGFDGCFTRVPDPDGAESNDKLGRMMGWVATQTSLSVDDQFDYYQKRFLVASAVGSVRNAKSTLRKAARDEQSLLSPVKLEELFSEAAWRSQPVIEVPELEAMTRARHRGIGINPLVADVYGLPQASHGVVTRPPGGLRRSGTDQRRPLTTNIDHQITEAY
jgi:hypothetical protein